MKDTGGPAFPAWEQDTYGAKFFNEGMTLRDWFAGKAMQGLLADRSWQAMTTDQCAGFAYLMADAMLKERSKE